MREGIKHYVRLQTMRVYSKNSNQGIENAEDVLTSDYEKFQASLTNMETLVFVLNCLIY